MTRHHPSPAAPFPERHDDDLLTLDEVAEILQTPENTLRWWRQTGTGPEFFKLGRRLFTTVGDVRHWIRRQRLASAPAARIRKVD